MAKRPPIPFDLIEQLYEEEDAVIAGFIRVAIRMVARGIVEKPLEAHTEKMAYLASRDWVKHQTRLKSLLESFYGPFIDGWLKHTHKVDRLSKMGKRSAHKWSRLNEMLKRHVTNVTESTLQDAISEFSLQPHTLNRGFRGNTLAPAISSQVATPKPASNKPRLKDPE